MERAFLVSSTLCFLAGFAYTMYALGAKVRHPSRWNFVVMLTGFILQSGFLHLRGQRCRALPAHEPFRGARLPELVDGAALPRHRAGPTGSRCSGHFTAPLVFLIQVVALLLPVASQPRCGRIVRLLAGTARGDFARGVRGLRAGVRRGRDVPRAGAALEDAHAEFVFPRSPADRESRRGDAAADARGLRAADRRHLRGLSRRARSRAPPSSSRSCVWLLYGALLIVRRTHRFSARRMAWLSVAAFAMVLTTLGALSFLHLGN